MSLDDQNPCDWRNCENYDTSCGGSCGVYTPNKECNKSHTTTPNEQPSSVYNGMLLPLTNFTIKGAMWYQGENNGMNPGDFIKNQGYACLLPRLINNWRRDWINNNAAHNHNNNNNKRLLDANSFIDGNSNISIPFGIVSLHGWCGEEASNCYPARNYSDITTTNDPTMYNLAWLRWAQVGSLGRVPNYVMSKTFVAMAYDLADTQAPPPPQPYEGGLHPRNKFTLGKRLSRGALAIAYENDTIGYTGPVLSFCDVDYNNGSINLVFDSDLLRNENIIIKHNYGFEVQTNASFGGWFDVNITNINSANSLQLNVGNALLSNGDGDNYNKVIGLRYAWRDVPCCNVTEWAKDKKVTQPCPEANCAVYTENSDLPLIPFIYQIDFKGQCSIPVAYS